MLSLRLLPTLLLLAALGCAPAEQSSPPNHLDQSTEQASSLKTDSVQAAQAAPSLEVATLCYPVDWLVERLGGELVMRRLMIPPGAEPSSWRPPAEVIVELQEMDLIVMNGAGYEAWTAQANLPLSRLVDASADLELIETSGRTHSHGTGGEHSHTGRDPHAWMDPGLYLEQARRIHATLIAAAPADQAHFDAALAALEQELGALASEMEQALAPLAGLPMAANHPSFAYLAQRFSLRIEVIDLDPQRSPTAEQLASLTAWASDQQTPVLLWTELPEEHVRAALPPTIQHLRLDPLERPTAERYDYIAQMRVNLREIASLLLGPAAG